MQIEYGEYNISDSLVRIRTISPIIAKIQDDNNKSVYFSPQDVRFYSRLREKFENKYKVFYGQVPESNIDMLPIGKHNKVVTKYKNTWITAYHGCFQLYGKPEHLQFLYDIGLGVKTSLGFGMFEVMQKNNC
jgi:CRISPR-associated endoribonuclease Cas6